MKTAVKVQRVRVMWPDSKGRLRRQWAYRIGDEPPQATPKIAREEHERTVRIRAALDNANKPPYTPEQLINTPLRSPANYPRKLPLVFAAMAAAVIDSGRKTP